MHQTTARCPKENLITFINIRECFLFAEVSLQTLIIKSVYFFLYVS